MVSDRAVDLEAREVADDWRDYGDATDAEAEVLRDLLQDDGTFQQIATAREATRRIDHNDGPYDAQVTIEALDASQALGRAQDEVVDARKADAQQIVFLAETLEEPWGAAMTLWKAGYQSVAAVRNATQHDLIGDGVHNSLAARVKAAVDAQEVDA